MDGRTAAMPHGPMNSCNQPDDLAPALGGSPIAWPFAVRSRPGFVMPEVAEQLAAESEARQAIIRDLSGLSTQIASDINRMRRRSS